MAGRHVVIAVFVLVIAALLGAMALVMVRREASTFGGFGINSVGRMVEIRERPAPPFTLQSLDGRPVALADLRGKAVVVN
jgi:cytochrome oxidase Cu insertion factor (SCO1/SenC/PrrC family)